jgi:methionine-rich copper-binding protein CopC
MTRKRALWILLSLSAVSSLVAPDLGARENAAHITLSASIPADGQTVSGDVKEIRLVFSGAPLLRGASVRIVTASRSLVRSSPPAADPDDPKQLFTQIERALPPGSYVIQWRCIADDGHVMRGDFRFTVTAG